MYYYRKNKEIKVSVGIFIGNHFGFSENIPGSEQDEKCFTCKNFIGCTEPCDIRCKKEKCVLNIVGNHTIRQCEKNRWFKL